MCSAARIPHPAAAAQSAGNLGSRGQKKMASKTAVTLHFYGPAATRRRARGFTCVKGRVSIDHPAAPRRVLGRENRPLIVQNPSARAAWQIRCRREVEGGESRSRRAIRNGITARAQGMTRLSVAPCRQSGFDHQRCARSRPQEVGSRKADAARRSTNVIRKGISPPWVSCGKVRSGSALTGSLSFLLRRCFLSGGVERRSSCHF